MLHGLGRRWRPRLVRDSCATGRGSRRSRRSKASIPRCCRCGPTRSATAGASQCGFCTPGIIMRLAALYRAKAGCHCGRGVDRPCGAPLQMHRMEDDPRCSCERADGLCAATSAGTCTCAGYERTRRDLVAASVRARDRGTLHAVGRRRRCVPGSEASPTTLPLLGALVAVPDGEGGWSVAGTLTEARRLAKKVQGRNSGARVSWPLEVPEGDWALQLQTTFVEPAYLEPDASWCEPGGEPASPVANGGAFGGKSALDRDRRQPAKLAAEHGRPVRVLLSREDVVRLGPKRPPIAAGLRPDGSGSGRVGRTPGSGDLSRLGRAFVVVRARCSVEVVDIAGPPVSADVRGAGWVEAAVLTRRRCASVPVRRRQRRPLGASGGRRRRRLPRVGMRGGGRRREGPGDRRRRRGARRGRAPLLLRRGRAPGPRMGEARGGRGRCLGTGARPDDPVLRHPARSRHARRGGRSGRGPKGPPSTHRTPSSLRQRRRLG